MGWASVSAPRGRLPCARSCPVTRDRGPGWGTGQAHPHQAQELMLGSWGEDRAHTGEGKGPGATAMVLVGAPASTD